MQVLYPRCAGLDVHKDTVVAAFRVAKEGAKPAFDVREFGTTTSELLKLAEWLSEKGCTHVVMEATGVYWKPVWAVLESAEVFELMLANAAHVKNVPGRKTDINDAMWLAELLAHGLIRGSFVPPANVQHMRDLSRTRKQFIRERTSHILRIQKTLETANIKLSSVLSDVVGRSGRAILQAIVDGESNPEVLVTLTSSKVKASKKEITEALRGHITDHHRFMLKLYLNQIDHLDSGIRELEARLGNALEPFREKLNRIIEMPGFDVQSASALLSEIGTEMERFPSADHLVSWATLCPRQDESAGKHRSTRIRKGGTWLKPLLVQAAWNAARTRESFYRAKYQRLKGRRGAKKAIVAVAASMLRAIWWMLKENLSYDELGARHFSAKDHAKIANALVRRLTSMGYSVTLATAA